MAERIIELKTCYLILPDGFDANQWSYDAWLSLREWEMNSGETVKATQEQPRRKAISLKSENSTEIR